MKHNCSSHSRNWYWHFWFMGVFYVIHLDYKTKLCAYVTQGRVFGVYREIDGGSSGQGIMLGVVAFGWGVFVMWEPRDV